MELPRPQLDCGWVLPSAEAIDADWRMEHPDKAEALDHWVRLEPPRGHIARRGSVAPDTQIICTQQSPFIPFLIGVIVGIIVTWSLI
jgi:hypothetical protein